MDLPDIPLYESILYIMGKSKSFLSPIKVYNIHATQNAFQTTSKRGR